METAGLPLLLVSHLLTPLTVVHEEEYEPGPDVTLLVKGEDVPVGETQNLKHLNSTIVQLRLAHGLAV